MAIPPLSDAQPYGNGVSATSFKEEAYSEETKQGADSINSANSTIFSHAPKRLWGSSTSWRAGSERYFIAQAEPDSVSEGSTKTKYGVLIQKIQAGEIKNLEQLYNYIRSEGFPVVPPETIEKLYGTPQRDMQDKAIAVPSPKYGYNNELLEELRGVLNVSASNPENTSSPLLAEFDEVDMIVRELNKPGTLMMFAGRGNVHRTRAMHLGGDPIAGASCVDSSEKNRDTRDVSPGAHQELDNKDPETLCTHEARLIITALQHGIDQTTNPTRNIGEIDKVSGSKKLAYYLTALNYFQYVKTQASERKVEVKYG